MPLTKAGSDVLASMIKEYGKKKGTQVFYASINKGAKGSEKWHKKKKRKTYSAGTASRAK